MPRIDLSSSDQRRAEKILNDLGFAEADMDLDDLMRIVLAAFRDQRELDSKIASEPRNYSEADLKAPADVESYYQGCRQASETILNPRLREG